MKNGEIAANANMPWLPPPYGRPDSNARRKMTTQIGMPMNSLRITLGRALERDGGVLTTGCGLGVN